MVLARIEYTRCPDRALLLANAVLRMNYLDWLVLFGTIIFIVVYGSRKTRGHKTIEGYLKGDNSR